MIVPDITRSAEYGRAGDQTLFTPK